MNATDSHLSHSVTARWDRFRPRLRMNIQQHHDLCKLNINESIADCVTWSDLLWCLRQWMPVSQIIWRAISSDLVKLSLKVSQPMMAAAGHQGRHWHTYSTAAIGQWSFQQSKAKSESNIDFKNKQNQFLNFNKESMPNSSTWNPLPPPAATAGAKVTFKEDGPVCFHSIVCSPQSNSLPIGQCPQLLQ